MTCKRPPEQIGQYLFVGIPEPQLDNATKEKLFDLRPGGVILFDRNYRDPETLRALCADLHDLRAEDSLWIAIDHEGGRVDRLSPPFTHFPAARAVGLTEDVHLAYSVAKALGKELRWAGIDIDFAPVLDVLTGVHNTVIGDRAFGTDPSKVAAFGVATAMGLHDAGLLPCGKHFPGHGATNVDSHLDLPHDQRERDVLMKTDIPPFKAVIDQGIELLMTAHVEYTSLDATRPASLSSSIMNNLLRRELGYTGLIVSDDLEMGAIVNYSSPEQAAVEALVSGADMLLVCQNLDQAISIRNACQEAVNRNVIPLGCLRTAQDRICRIKDKRRNVETDWEPGNTDHQSLVQDVKRRFIAPPPCG